MTLWKIPLRELERRLDVCSGQLALSYRAPLDDFVHHVVSLRDIRKVFSVTPLKLELVWEMLKRVRTAEGEQPFKSCSMNDITLVSMDPRLLKVGQKFVYREKYTSLLEHVPDLFKGHCLAKGGIHTLGAYAVVGEDSEKAISLAFYFPPLVERHGFDFILMDGIHRNFICHQHGTTTSAFLINKVSTPFPCEAKHWSATQVIPLSERPKNIEDRFFNLAPKYMRDLKFLGIDG